MLYFIYKIKNGSNRSNKQANKSYNRRIRKQNKNQKDLHYILRQWCKFVCLFLGQYYIPDESQ